MLKYLYEVYNSLKGLKKWGETTKVLGRNDYGGGERPGIKFGAK